MAAKESNSLVISFSVFVVLALIFGILLYFAYDYKNQLNGQLAERTAAESNASSVIKNLQNEVAALKSTIGYPGETDEIVDGTQKLIAEHAGEASASASTLIQALESNARNRDLASQTATDRLTQTYARIDELSRQIASHERAMQDNKATLAAKEDELRQKDAQHSRNLAEAERAIDARKLELRTTQKSYDEFLRTSRDEIALLNQEIVQQRQALITLRRDKLKLEGGTIESQDGTVTVVDLRAGTCYIDIGVRDELRLGTEFSVYAADQDSKVRALNARERKGRIEVVRLLDDHLAEGRIVSQKVENPVTVGDALFSSLFERGKKLQIAVVGMLDFDGNPGSDREEFRRLTTAAGIDTVLEVDDEARLIGRGGELLSSSEIPKRITSDTRFLVVGDPGDRSQADEAANLILDQMELLQKEMTRAAENNGVYVLSLSSFLDFIEYSSKSLASSGPVTR